MQSFRTELENPVVEQDIIDLERKIKRYKDGNIDEDKFRSLRLARGVYGQRQPGVQMVRIKIPFGKLSARQLRTIADISDEYGSGNLHATTRQDIQIHYVSLDRTPELWARLEKDDITLREACGNTVRNIVASPKAGIDPEEPFDVSPYAQEMFEFFLRNPICQAMGRKFKISFSSSEKDTGLSFIHDIGIIPKLRVVDGQEQRGFKIFIGGGLGAQPYPAQLAFEFLPEEELMPFAEALVRVFDRYGERKRRVKARFKFLLQDLGLEKVMELVNQERLALKHKRYQVKHEDYTQPVPTEKNGFPFLDFNGDIAYQEWLATNVFEQKQRGFFGVFIKLPLGDLKSEKARKLADVVDRHASSDDLRVTANQGYLLKFVSPKALPSLYQELKKLGLAAAGFDSTADITACPGTDSCNLGISNSTNISLELEKVITQEYPDLVHNQDLKIKISGCPNSCGQHTIAAIGFHGSSLKNKANGMVLPALQVLLGGGAQYDGVGHIATKIIKVPSKKGPDVLRALFDDYDEHGKEGEYYAHYFLRQGNDYFYQLLKPFANLEDLKPDDYIDWGHNRQYFVKTEVGECAGVIVDLVATLLYEAEEELNWAAEAFEKDWLADGIYRAYNAYIHTAKALLTDHGATLNTQAGIMDKFDEDFRASGAFQFEGGFKEHVLQLNKHEPSEEFAETYFQGARKFFADALAYRKAQQLDHVPAKVLS